MKGALDLILTCHIFPCLCVLLANKTQETYSSMWNKVRELCPTACPTHLIVDFEIVSINAFSQHFVTTMFKAVFFIYKCQNVWRKVQQLGLAATCP